jgi:3-oxoacyl-[acyl-carrier protein] reductase
LDYKNKNILCFGGNSYLARAFNDLYSKEYNILNVYRRAGTGLYLDFDLELDAMRFAADISVKIDGIVFFQGINPSVGLKEMTCEHFSKMMRVNLIMPTMVIKALKEKINLSGSVIFFSSIAKRKGSYDPSYAAAKSAISGLIQSLANQCPEFRFNILSLGLVEGSPVHLGMTPDYVKRHTDKMFQGKLIKKEDVIKVIDELIRNESINRSEISLDGGYL